MLGRSVQTPGGLLRTSWEAHPVGGDSPVVRYDLPQSAYNATWSPDGHTLTFIDSDDPHWNLYRQGPSGPPAPVTRFTDGRVTSMRWSPDGRKLGLVRQIGNNSNAWVTEADGSRPVQVTHFPTDDAFYVRWFPDSHRLLVSAGKKSQDAVLVRSFR
jgi:Tol biopolymer transport system component